jgi:hypothetical protein
MRHLTFAATLLALVAAASPALAVDYPVSVTFIVPTTVTDFPLPPDGVTALSVYCSVYAKAGGAKLGSTYTDIPVTTVNGKQNFSGSITVKVTLGAAAHTGDSYACDFGSSGGAPGKGFKPATTILAVSGVLP